MVFSQVEEVSYIRLNNVSRNDYMARKISSNYFDAAWPKWCFHILLIVIGIAGNSLILSNFLKQRSKNATNFYILVLASIDLFGCCIVIPLQIAQTSNYYSSFNKTTCQLFEWMTSASLASSSIVLQATAIDRYQAVCKPFTWRKIGPLRTKLALIFCVILGALLTSPLFLIVGIQRYLVTPTSLRDYGFSDEIYNGFRGNQSYIYVCEVLDQYQDSWQSQSVGFVLMAIFVVLVSVTMISYTLIYLTMKRQLSFRGTKVWVSPSASAQPIQDDAPTGPQFSTSYPTTMTTTSAGIGPEISQHPGPHNHASVSKNSTGVTSVRNNQYRATRALMVVTVVFILSWIPFWINALRATVNPLFANYLTIGRQITTEFFNELFFLNNALNAVVYYVYNRAFRQYCKDICCNSRCGKRR